MNYGYIQEDGERLEITKFAKDHNLEIDNWLEIQSGNWNQATLEELLKPIQKDLKAQAEIMQNEMITAYNKFKYWCEWNGYVYMPKIERKSKHATRN